jgi:hypothetical protein
MGGVVGLFLVVEGFSFPFPLSSSLSSSSSFSSFPLSSSFSFSSSFLLFPSPSLFVPSSLLFPGLDSAVNVLLVGFCLHLRRYHRLWQRHQYLLLRCRRPPPLSMQQLGMQLCCLFSLFFLRRSHCRTDSSFSSSSFCSHIVFSSIDKSTWYSEYSGFVLCRSLVALAFAARSFFASSDNGFLTLFFPFNVVISQVDLEMIGPTTTKKLDKSRSETPLESRCFDNIFFKVQCVDI